MFDKPNVLGFVIRKDNSSNNSLFFSCRMGLSDGAFFMIKHTPLLNGNHPISNPIYQMGVTDSLEHNSPGPFLFVFYKLGYDTHDLV